MSFEDIKAKAKPREGRARILLNGDLLEEHARLEASLVATADDSLAQPPDRRAIAQQILDVQHAIEEAEDEFVFRSIGTSAWYELMAKHPPSAADKAINPRADHNAQTFPPAAVAASCVEPELTVDDALWLFDNAPLSEWRKLWDAFLDVNLGAAERPKSLIASALLRSNGTSSPTAGPEESLAASS